MRLQTHVHTERCVRACISECACVFIYLFTCMYAYMHASVCFCVGGAGTQQNIRTAYTYHIAKNKISTRGGLKILTDGTRYTKHTLTV